MKYLLFLWQGLTVNNPFFHRLQGYLLWTKIPNTDPAQFSVQWGSRAEKEVSKMDCLKFVCEVYSHKSEVEVSPKDWQVQYKEAATADGAATQATDQDED